MRICTITCHDVYNHGASLQAYALERYLTELGHTVRIIDYKPPYLSGHYRLDAVGNPKFDRPLVRQAYLLAKLPGRLALLPRKRAFDRFTAARLQLTRRYDSNEALRADPPEAEAYFAGSDQIWNPLFPNGRDPAFYLDFAPRGAIRASYAASFATDTIPPACREQMRGWLKELDAVSVRERSGAALAAQLGVEAVCVPDPVFLLEREAWEALAVPPKCGPEPYLLVYDFDRSPQLREAAQALARERGLRIYSLFPCGYADRCFRLAGPETFLGLVRGAAFVLSNSFHATAFALIFQREFAVAPRAEQINERMRDLTARLGLEGRMLARQPGTLPPISWPEVRRRLDAETARGKAYIQKVLKGGGCDEKEGTVCN